MASATDTNGTVHIAPTPINTQTAMEPPNNLNKFDAKRVIFCGAALLLLSFIWFCALVTLYVVSAQANNSTLYEARWLLVTVPIAAINLLLLSWLKSETFFIVALITGLYSIASGSVVGITYSWNLHTIIQPAAENDLIINTVLKTKTKKQYVQLCLCLMITSLFIVVMSVYTVWTLCKTAKRTYKPIVLRSTTTKLLFTSGVSQVCLALFSVYATAQLLGARTPYMHMYLIQEFHCSLLLLTLGLLQVVTSWRVNGMLLRSLLALNVCQLVQELFYTWNAYYVALYLHTGGGRKGNLPPESQYDQVLMTTNFICHFSRLCCTAYVAVHLSPIVSAVSTKLTLELSRGATQLLSVASILLFLLGTAHILMDLSYTISENVYRTLIAFTGVSVFYTFMAAFSLIIYSRRRQVLYLMTTCVFLLLLIGASVHGLYVYIDTTYSQTLVRHLEHSDKSNTQPLLMHFTEGLLCLFGVIISVPLCFLILRLLRMDSQHLSHLQSGHILYGIFGQGVVLMILTVAEIIIMLCVRDNWRLFDTNMAYSAMDVISMLMTSGLQIAVVNPKNKHYSQHLFVLTFVLLSEVITTFNYLNTYTTYIQLLVLLYRLMGGYGNPATTNSFTFMFTSAHITPLLVSHVLQLLQWVLTVSSLISCCLLIERLYNPTELPERPQLNGNDSAGATSVCQRVPLKNDCERELSDSNLSVKFCYENAIISNSDELPTVSTTETA